MDNIELTQPNTRYLEPLLLMINERGKYRDVSQAAGPAFGVRVAARGVAAADLNNDGWVDLVVSCNDGVRLS
jgi:enediyne biosynthesis protein E4